MNDLRAIWLVTRREACQRLTSRAFVIFTAIVVTVVFIGIVAVGEVPSLVNGTKRLGVVGRQPGLAGAIASAARQRSEQVALTFLPDQVSGEAALREDRLDALLVLDDQTLLFRSEQDGGLRAIVDSALTEVSLPARAQALGLSVEQARNLIAPPGVKVTLVAPKVTRPGANNRWAAASVAVIALYVSLAMYGNWVLMGVVEEKTSRVVEVLLGVLRPEQLLTGKVLGIVCTAMVQLGIAVLAGLAALALYGSANIPAVALDVAIVSIIFFILGIVFYNFIYAAVGSTVARQSEAASASMPVAMSLLAPYLYALTYVPSHPDIPLSRILSLVPLSAPLVMPARVATGTVSIAEVALAVLLMLPALALMIWLSGRIYVGAILRSGPRISVLDAFRSATGGSKART